MNIVDRSLKNILNTALKSESFTAKQCFIKNENKLKVSEALAKMIFTVYEYFDKVVYYVIHQVCKFVFPYSQYINLI